MNGISITFLLFLGLTAQCAEISIDPAIIQAGSTTPIAVRFAAMGNPVAALQFDLEYDSSLALTATAGPSATGAAKNIYTAPVATRRMRVLVVGRNQYTLLDGVVVSLTAFARGAPGVFALRLTNASASDPDGNLVVLANADGAVTIEDDTHLPASGAFAQVVSGGAWKTSFTLLNLSSTESAAQLNFRDADGAPLALPLVFSPDLGLSPGSSASADLVIPPNRSVVVETEVPDSSTVLAGWARLRTPGGLVASATLRYRTAEGLDREAVVPLETRTPFSFVLPFDNTAGLLTGVAVANGSDAAPANIEVTARDDAGTQLFTDSIPLPVSGHSFFSLADKYPRLFGIRGSLEFRELNGANIAVLGLLFNQFGSFTWIPVDTR